MMVRAFSLFATWLGLIVPPPGFDPLCQDLDLSGYYCYDRFESTTMSHWCLAKTPVGID